MKDKINRFAIRKLSMGIASVAVASFIWLTSLTHQTHAQEQKSAYTSGNSSDQGQSIGLAESVESHEVSENTSGDSQTQVNQASLNLPDGYTETELKQASPNLSQSGQSGLEGNKFYQPSQAETDSLIPSEGLQPKQALELSRWVAKLINPIRTSWGHQAYQADPSLQAASQSLSDRYQAQNWDPVTQGPQTQLEQESLGKLSTSVKHYWLSFNTPKAIENLGQLKQAIHQQLLSLLFQGQADNYQGARYLLSLDSAVASRQPSLALTLNKSTRGDQTNVYLMSLTFLTPAKEAGPVQTDSSSDSGQSSDSSQPELPTNPILPQDPVLPLDPITPPGPVLPADPVSPPDPVSPQPEPPQEPNKPEPSQAPDQLGQDQVQDQTPDQLDQRPRRDLPSLVEKGNLMAQKQQESNESLEEEEESSSSSTQVSHSSSVSASSSVEMSERHTVSSSEPDLPSSGEDDGYWLLLGGVSAVAAAAGLIYLKQVEIRRRQG